MRRRPPGSTRTEHSFPTRRSSDLSSDGQPNQPLSGSPEKAMAMGSITSAPIHQVWNMFQPPLSTGSRLARRDVSVAQSIAWISTLKPALRSEEHTSELQSLMRISYAVFCLKKKQSQAYIER